jgi:hypothetical protein
MAGNDGVHRSSGVGWATPKGKRIGGRTSKYAPKLGFKTVGCSNGKHHECNSLKCTCSCHGRTR